MTQTAPLASQSSADSQPPADSQVTADTQADPAARAESRPPVCKVAYVMSRFPKLTETFVLFEMLAVEQQRVQVEIFPLLGKASSGKEVAGAGIWRKVRDHFRASKQPPVMHAEAQPCVARARYMPFVNAAVLAANLSMAGRHPLRYLITLAVIVRENFGNANFLLGALTVFPKCVYFARCMQREGVQYIHAHFANHPAAAAYMIHRLSGIPYSFTAHGSDLHRHQQMLAEKVDKANFVVTVSQYNREVIREHCGQRCEDKIQVIHCGVDVDKFRPADGRRADGAPDEKRPGATDGLQIICVGTLHEVKGQQYLLRAVGRLRRGGLACQIHFVGEGPDRAMLEDVTREESLQSQVTFHGTQTRDQLIERFQAADLLVTPSVPTSDGRREGIPVVLMEGMACGLPVVASRLSGIPELVNSDRVGRLCEPKNVAELAAAIEEFAHDPALRQSVGQQARQRIMQEFSLAGNAEKLLALFQRSASSDPQPEANQR